MVFIKKKKNWKTLNKMSLNLPTRPRTLCILADNIFGAVSVVVLYRNSRIGGVTGSYFNIVPERGGDAETGLVHKM